MSTPLREPASANRRAGKCRDGPAWLVPELRSSRQDGGEDRAGEAPTKQEVVASLGEASARICAQERQLLSLSKTRRERNPAATMSAARGPGSATVSAVILTYQRLDFLPDCLGTVREALALVEGYTEIVVVDNASAGNAATPRIAELCPEAVVVTLTENRGYAGGLNAGLQMATGEWILTIGDDATIEPAAVTRMLATGSSGDRIGSVAAKMLFADLSRGHVINSAGLEIDRLGKAIDRLLGAPEAESETEATEVFGTSGAAALYRREMLEDIGGFDSTFGVYLEDADVAWRARSAGWRCLYEPGAVVLHHHSATSHHRSDYKYFHVGRNRVRLLAKNASTRHLVRWAPLMVLYDLAYIAYALVVDHTTAPIKGRVSGLRDWRRYRATRREGADVDLAPAKGLRFALQRNAAVAAHRSKQV